MSETADNHALANRTGELISQDLYFVGTIIGVGNIYMQLALDCPNSVGFARIFLKKLPIQAVPLAHEKSLSLYDVLGVTPSAILTVCGREFCRRSDRHIFELYLCSQNIEHRTTRPASP